MIDYVEERRFASTVDLYRRYRPRYPADYAASLAHQLALGPEDTVMDLGCGPGFLGLAIRPFVGKVIAVDPEPLMLEAAKAEATVQGLSLELVVGSSATIEPGATPLAAVLMGRSFHWMDREATLLRLDRMLAPRGAVAICRSDPGKADWSDAVAAVRAAFAPDPLHPRQLGRLDHAAVLAASPFADISTLTFVSEDHVDPDTVVGHALTLSSTSPARLGERQAAFEAAIRAAIQPYLVDGRLKRVLTYEAIIARRPTH